jgi:spore germination protein
MYFGRTLSLGVLASALLLTSCGGNSGTSPSPTPSPTAIPSPPATNKVVMGYWLGDNSSVTAMALFFGYLNVASADVFTVTGDGGVAGAVPTDLVGFDAANGIKTYACVTNYSNATGGFDPSLAHSAIVTNKSATVRSLVALARSGGFVGVNLDIENLNTGDLKADRAGFSAFVAELGPALHAQGLTLAISVPAKESDDISNDWGYPFDFAALSPYADMIQLMTYDEHFQGGDPGPVAGRDWMERCIVFAKGQIPAAKIVIGLPAYGYDFDLDNANLDTSFQWNSVPTLLTSTGATVLYHQSSDSPYIAYTDASGHRHQAWFENIQSITIKSGLVNKYGLGGIAMWRLGYEDLSFWTAARTGLN